MLSHRQKTILLVDDDQHQLVLRKTLLELSGYALLTANGGVDALRLFAAHEIALVILDYQMPGMNGDLVGVKMKEYKPEVPLLMLSGYYVSDDALRHVDAFMPKSSEPIFLVQMIEQLLSRFEKRGPQRASIRHQWKKTAGAP